MSRSHRIERYQTHRRKASDDHTETSRSRQRNVANTSLPISKTEIKIQKKIRKNKLKYKLRISDLPKPHKNPNSLHTQLTTKILHQTASPQKYGSLTQIKPDDVILVYIHVQIINYRVYTSENNGDLRGSYLTYWPRGSCPDCLDEWHASILTRVHA